MSGDEKNNSGDQLVDNVRDHGKGEDNDDDVLRFLR